MDTYIITVKVVLEVDAVDQATAIALAEDAVQRTRFGAGHKMVSIREYGKLAEERSIPGMIHRERAAKSV